MSEKKPSFTRRFKLGIGLIVGSLLCGYTALAFVGGAVGAGSSRLRDLSLAIWLLTWIPFTAGFLLSGREGLQYAKDLIKKYIFKG